MRMRVVILRVSHASIVPAEAVSLNPRRAVRRHERLSPTKSATPKNPLPTHQQVPLDHKPHITQSRGNLVTSY